MEDPTEYNKGDVVWVQSGNQHEEPATVLRTSCSHEPDAEDSDDEGSNAAIRRDGIMVRFNVSKIRGIFAPEKLRPLEDSKTAEQGQRRVRRSSRASKSTTPTIGATRTAPSRVDRSVVTPSPNSTTVTTSSTQQEEEDVAEPMVLDDEFGKDFQESDKKPAAKRKGSSTVASTTDYSASRKKRSKRENQAVEEEEVEPNPEMGSSSPYFPKKVSRVASTTASAKKMATAVPGQKVTKKAAPKTKGLLMVNKSSDSEAADSSSSDSSSSDSESVAGNVAVGNNNNNSGGDSDQALDRPFTVEYAPSGRATCRRCDQVITKDELRVSHLGLFRGRDPSRYYRHLECTVFSDQIHTAADVGGWRRLRQKDYEALVLRIEESKIEREEENKELQPDELVQASFQGEIRSPPKGLTANLLPFQVEGFSWMRHQEVMVPELRGGILADEMGMGKTLQTIATIMDNMPILQHSKPGAKHPPSASDREARLAEEALWKESVQSWHHEMKMVNVPKKIWPKKHAAARAGTLVVCPVIALSQWKSEIEKFSEPGSLTVGIYHGPNRASEMPPDMMQKYDVVLTTYQVMEQDFRKMTSPNKVTCPNCGGKFKIDKLRVHLTYFCGAGAQRTEAQARQRRTAPGRGGRAGGGGGGGGGGGPKNSKKSFKSASKTKSFQTKTFGKKTATKKSTEKKKTVRVQRTGDYDSDSDLTVDGPLPQVDSGSRPSRSAAKKASRQLSASVLEWGTNPSSSSRRAASNRANGDDDSSFNSSERSDDSASESSQEDSSSEDEPISNLAKTSKSQKKIPRKRVASRSSSPSTSNSSSDDSDDSVERVREMQRKALTNSKKKAPKKAASTRKSTMTKKKGKGKKFDSSSSSSSSDDEEGDPMAGIDMKELVDEAMSGARFSVLHSFGWWRIVLDEAHYIKSRSSQTAAAAFSLTSINRWCLSGTPLQNRVGELYSLIRFLRLDPMAYYFCRMKGCDCKCIHYRMKSGICQDCGHRSFSHFAHFNKHVLNVIQRDGYTGDGRRAMFKLKNEVLDKCLLRRTKESRAEDMNLPPRFVKILPIRLHPIEEDFYNGLYTQTRASFDDYVTEGTLLNNYAHIFDLLTKMRQAVNHPYLIVHSKNAKALGGQAPVANGSVDCDICHEPPTERVVSSCCGSGFCRSCVIDYLTGAGGENTPCPSCSSPLTIDLNQASSQVAEDDGTLTVARPSGAVDTSTVPSLKELSHVPSGSILRRINLAEFATSSKIEVLTKELIEMRQKRPGNKALVFSQFVNMLDLIRWRLHSDPCLADMGIGVRILHGGMNVKNRDAALKDFREDNGVRVLLMSLKAGGVALNLTVASEVYLVDNWWNPAAEMQAIDRTHRLGQHKPIRAVRFIAEGTVEERVLQLQEKKRLVFDGTVGRDAGSLKMLTVSDMKALFT